MIGLKLRDEFLDSNMPGTAIELRTDDKRGAVDQKADYRLTDVGKAYLSSDLAISRRK
jgi:hypothetical protein